MSLNPSVVTSAVRAPRRSSRAFVATVMPWASAARAPASTPEAPMAFITPTDWSCGVEGTFAVTSVPSERTTRSVNVPPTSTPRRVSPKSLPLLGDELAFLGLFLVDVFAVGLLRQGVAQEAQGADRCDVDGDQGCAAR